MTHDLAQMQADIHWQLAKGHLQAVVAVHGARLSGGAHNKVESKLEVFESILKGFIAEIEDKELHL